MREMLAKMSVGKEYGEFGDDLDFDEVTMLTSDQMTCPEMFDLDEVFPDIPSISPVFEDHTFPVEQYCFEDFPDRSGFKKCEEVREEDMVEYCSTLYSTLQALLGAGQLDWKPSCSPTGIVTTLVASAMESGDQGSDLG
ncbi:uncharacterized protein LOC135470319 [Liolophura sinensis]|uniref:uncharacterized protein LOC135470319 n=1 Tax=Liolophura sinensis TaxID=3198878 RepID=UPI0031589BF0